MTTYKNNYRLSPDSLDEWEIFDLCRNAGIKTDFEGQRIFAYLWGMFAGKPIKVKTELTNATKVQVLRAIA